MAISDQDRYEMHKWFEEQAGPGVAGTVMAHLPPVGWADVATKRDIEMLELRIDRLGDQLRAEFHQSLRVQLMVILGFNMSMLGVMLGAAVALFG